MHLVSSFLSGPRRNMMRMMSYSFPVLLLSLRPRDNFLFYSLFYFYSIFTLLIFGGWLSLSFTANVSKGRKHRIQVGVGEIVLFLATDTCSPLTPCFCPDLGDTEQAYAESGDGRTAFGESTNNYPEQSLTPTERPFHKVHPFSFLIFRLLSFWSPPL